jgi:hypothetical protein
MRQLITAFHKNWRVYLIEAWALGMSYPQPDIQGRCFLVYSVSVYWRIPGCCNFQMDLIQLYFRPIRKLCSYSTRTAGFLGCISDGIFPLANHHRNCSF